MNSLSSKTNIYFRLDYGGYIGRGHLSRCLALALKFKEHGYNPVMVVRKRPENQSDNLQVDTIWLENSQGLAHALTTDTSTWKMGTEEDEALEMHQHIAKDSIIVLDHYGLGLIWQKKMKSLGHKIILIQDVCSPDFDAEIIINYNMNAKDIYEKHLLNKETLFLLGPEYAPLAQEYSKEHKKNINGPISQVGIYLGGIEIKNLEKVARAIVKIEFFQNKKIEWVVGNDIEKAILQTILKGYAIVIHVRLASLIPLYKKSHLFIGACGVSFLERACLGVRQINFLVADNQKEIAAGAGEVINLPVSTEDAIVQFLRQSLSEKNNDTQNNLIENFFEKVDGLGCDRLLKKITEKLVAV
ncbi:MAG: UDP-2,4-diacetamido-2,4,6-trideoxy-beta-L-altropyranose hydrolase [Bacteriovorax sp.]|jgi:UDP-2,4-diacetamido-2,4,6-trideoxy-beta-L-altropyranose hydrolase